METKQTFQCRICSHPGWGQMYSFQEKMVGEITELFSYAECENCRSLGILKLPENLGDFYGKNYYSLDRNLEGEFAKFSKRLALRQATRFALRMPSLGGQYFFSRFPYFSNHILQGIPEGTFSPRAKILDVGCGVGELVFLLKNAGFHHVYGIDPYLETKIRYNNGLEIENLDLENYPEKEFDLIIFNHSLEHIWSPLEALFLAREKLSGDGGILVRIPTPSGWAWETYRENWVQLDAPRHLNLISREGIQAMAKHLNMRVEYLIDDSTDFQFWGSIQYQKGVPLFSEKSYVVNPSQSLFTEKEIGNFKSQAHKLNKEGRGDQVTFLLKLP